MRKFIFLLFALLASTHTMKAQEVALKTNLVYDALLTVNLGAEVQLAPRWSLDLFASHALGGQYNVGNVDLDFKLLGTNFGAVRDHRYQGWYAGLGVAYGYSWLVSRHFNIEAELGVGWIHTGYDRYNCASCGRRLGKGHHNYFGPTKAAINLVYVF